MPANPTQRIRSVLAHFASLNYTPHAFFLDLLSSEDIAFAEAKQGLRAKAAALVPQLMFPGHSRLSAAMLCLRVIELPMDEFIIQFLGSRESVYARARAEVQRRIDEICALLLPGGNRGRISTALTCLTSLDLRLSDFCLKILSPTSTETHHDLVPAVPALLDALRALAPPEVMRWAMLYSCNEYGREILRTTEKSAGFHGLVTELKPEDLETFSIATLARRLQTLAPYTWDLFVHLVDADRASRRATGLGDAEVFTLDCVGDLGASGAQIVLNPRHEDAELRLDSMLSEAEDGTTPERIRAAAQRNNALRDIKVVTLFGIVQQSTNQRCNALQANMGIFLCLTRAPDILIQVLNHIGISVSNKSIGSACDSLDKACMARLAEQGETGTAQGAYDNYNFNDRVAVPTVDNDSEFVSATSALLICSHPTIKKEQFRYANTMWWRNAANEVPRFFPFPPPFLPTYDDILNLPVRLDLRHSRLGFDPQEDQIETIAITAARMLVEQGRFFSVYKSFLDAPPPVDVIPLHKTEYMPFRAMDLNQATVSGNIEAMESMMRQMNFPADMAEEYITLIHADLGGVERLQGAQAQRCDEDTGSAQLKNVLTCPGLFHVSMANADILFRVHLKPEARHDSSSLWKYICKLRPTKTERAKFTAKQGPGYRRMHDVSKHITWALILECWVLEAQAWDESCTTLEAFARRLSLLPTRQIAWNRIRTIARTIARKYVAGPEFQAARAKPLAQRDSQFENWQLFLQISFVDQIFDYALKTQDVGRVLISLCDLIFAYQGAKKHKYAYQIMQTLVMLAYVCPEPLRRAFLTSWIINPTGKPMGGRGVDWLVELFNLYLKQMHCGKSSNYGLQHMMDMSTLISLFKYVFDNFIVNYHITSHTTRHQGPNMHETIDELRKVIRSDRAMIFTPGRTSPYEVDDVMTMGQASFMCGAAAELAAQDVEAEITRSLEDYD